MHNCNDLRSDLDTIFITSENSQPFHQAHEILASTKITLSTGLSFLHVSKSLWNCLFLDLFGAKCFEHNLGFIQLIRAPQKSLYYFCLNKTNVCQNTFGTPHLI